MQIVRCILIDDEPKGLKLLQTYCEQLEHCCEVVDLFLSAEKFLEKHKKLQYDLLLLDIDMPGINGTDLARMLSDKPVVFVTGRDGFDKEVVDLQFGQDNIVALIRKPLSKEVVEKALKKFMTFRSKRGFAAFKTPNGDRNISFDDILLITTKHEGFKQGVLAKNNIPRDFDPRNKIMVTTKEVLVVSQTDFTDFKAVLPGDNFFLINRSTIVARKAIDNFDSEGLLLKPDLKNIIALAQFNVSEDNLKAFRRWYSPK
jgi:DNA-binding LytR/AlgR family response regulator